MGCRRGMLALVVGGLLVRMQLFTFGIVRSCIRSGHGSLGRHVSHLLCLLIMYSCGQLVLFMRAPPGAVAAAAAVAQPWLNTHPRVLGSDCRRTTSIPINCAAQLLELQRESVKFYGQTLVIQLHGFPFAL